ncbi:hypothetical protein P154DRAFT_525693 [Amniculicola lignicola CBS 123094]|uniref:GPI anchored cell wall protein n=1 Tax=Amniculicola lignicola CBS 123094 TaxID=1392246 RepID=A0A6A5W385_9PLEO|nr:hypothetical protein P154DRAFT_525693 [Amniculicola lignicola CBS 123094]
MKTSSVALLASLFSYTYAQAASGPTVTLKMTPCISNDTELLEVGPIPLDKLFVQLLETVCGLELITASGIDINDISCQAYRDDAGTQLGSALFTKAEPALIATNPVQERSILCKSKNGGVSSTTARTNATTVITSTVTPVSSGTSLPTSGGNSTVLSVTGGPTATSSGAGATGTSDVPASAGKVGLSAGAVALGFAVWLL